MISQPPLIMYIFQPMFASPMGMTKTSNSLVKGSTHVNSISEQRLTQVH